MKKFIASFFATCLLFTSVFAYGYPNDHEMIDVSEDLTFDETEFEAEFAELEALEGFLEENEMSFEELEATQPNLVSGIDLAGHDASTSASMFTMDEMDWGSFAWGFLCCPIGFFVVGINKEKEQNQRTSFWIGVIASSVINVISSTIIYMSYWRYY